MKNERLLNVIGEIDERHIIEAVPAKRKNRRTVWMKFAATAACLCLVLTGIFGAARHTVLGEPDPSTVEPSPSTVEPSASAESNQQSLYFPQNKNNGNYIADIDLQYLSDTVTEMMEKSDAVIIARVTRDDEQWQSQPSGLENARSVVVAEEVLKGSIAVGDNVTIHETGWRYEDHDLSIAGEPLLRKDMRVILFLNEEAEGVRGIYGCYQGKIFLDENETAYPFTYFTGAKDDLINFTDMPDPMPLAELRKLLGIGE